MRAIGLGETQLRDAGPVAGYRMMSDRNFGRERPADRFPVSSVVNSICDVIAYCPCAGGA